jgi:hypothetical protein
MTWARTSTEVEVKEDMDEAVEGDKGEEVDGRAHEGPTHLLVDETVLHREGAGDVHVAVSGLEQHTDCGGVSGAAGRGVSCVIGSRGDIS